MLLNKRPGVLVHEDTAATENTLIMHIQAYLYQNGSYDPEAEQSFAPALCNRIDRNTGGIVIAAKNAEALRVMNEKIRNNEISKFYLCLVHGTPKPERATLHGYLRKNSADNRVEVRETHFSGAKEIITKYRVVAEKGTESLLEVELVTGRTHQIRVHMAHIGCPVAGDFLYGKEEEGLIDGHALHSKTLTFAHPITGEMMHFEADIPEDMKRILEIGEVES